MRSLDIPHDTAHHAGKPADKPEVHGIPLRPRPPILLAHRNTVDRCSIPRTVRHSPSLCDTHSLLWASLASRKLHKRDIRTGSGPITKDPYRPAESGLEVQNSLPSYSKIGPL